MQEPKKIRDYTRVIEHDLRPAGNGKDCFYCGQPLNGSHTERCVIRLGAGSFLVALRNNETGEVRLYRDNITWDDDHSHFMWTDGNYGCDCNRHMMFQRAHGDASDWDTPCGDERYTALYALLPDGTRKPLDLSIEVAK
jgi:hypothetical protein